MERTRRRAASPVVVDVAPPRFQQERARRTFAALVDAGTELFAAHGYDGTGSPDVAQKAGVSVGTFYRYFDDKKALYLAVARRHLDLGFEQIMSAMSPELFAGKARHETIAGAVQILFTYLSQHPGLNRSFEEMSLRDPEVAAMRHEFERAARQRLTVLITAVTTRDHVPDPAASAYIIHSCAVECAYGVAGQRGTLAISTPRLRTALVQLIERVMFASAPDSE